MKFLFSVADVRMVAGQGVVIGGVGSQFDLLTTEELREAIGERITVVVATGDASEFHVLGVESTVSLAGKRNVFVLVSEAANDTALQVGSMVYAVG